MLRVCLVYIFLKFTHSELTTEEVQYLNQLPIEKLIQLKNSLKDVIPHYDNTTLSAPEYLQTFGAQALAMKAPIKRGDYEETDVKKGGYGKISNIFSISVTTLAFLAFGGYLLCLIVHAVKSKQAMTIPTTQSTVFFNAGIKRPQTQHASYGREKREERSMKELDIPPEQIFLSLTHLCEGYVKWSKNHNKN